jgi:hypothetical protein
MRLNMSRKMFQIQFKDGKTVNAMGKNMVEAINSILAIHRDRSEYEVLSVEEIK